MVVRTRVSGPKIDAPAVEARARDGVLRLKRYHRIGCSIAAQIKRSGTRSLRDFLSRRELPLSPSSIYKAKRFAALYDGNALRELCALRNPAGMPLGWSVICRLLSIRDKKTRRVLARQTATRGWTTSQLAAEIERQLGNRRPGSGRRVRRPRSADEGLRHLQRKGREWLRVFEVVLGGPGEAQLRSSGDAAALRAELDDTIAALEKMKAAVEQGVRRLRAAKRRCRPRT